MFGYTMKYFLSKRNSPLLLDMKVWTVWRFRQQLVHKIILVQLVACWNHKIFAFKTWFKFRGPHLTVSLFFHAKLTTTFRNVLLMGKILKQIENIDFARVINCTCKLTYLCSYAYTCDHAPLREQCALLLLESNSHQQSSPAKYFVWTLNRKHCVKPFTVLFSNYFIESNFFWISV